MPVVVFPDPSRLGLFVASALVPLLTPGPAVLYIVARSLDQGRRRGSSRCSASTRARWSTWPQRRPGSRPS